MSFTGTKGAPIKLFQVATLEKLRRDKGEKRHLRRKNKDNEDKQTLSLMQSSLEKLSLPELKKISTGLTILLKISRRGMGVAYDQLMTSEKDLSEIKFNVLNFRFAFNHIVDYLRYTSRVAHDASFENELLQERTIACQAARDGKIMKQEVVTDFLNGEMRTKTYDTPMTDREVSKWYDQYYENVAKLTDRALTATIGLGFSVAGVIGTLGSRPEDSDSGKEASLIAMVTGAVGIVRFFQKGVFKEDRKAYHEKVSFKNFLIDDLTSNPTISNKATLDKQDFIKKVSADIVRGEFEKEGKIAKSDLIGDLLVAMMTGLYVRKYAQRTPDGKYFIGGSVSKALLSLSASRDVYSSIVDMFFDMPEIKDLYEKTREAAENLDSIREQLNKNVYSLNGPNKKVNQIELNGLDCYFHSKIDHETGEVVKGTHIRADHFSAKAGEVVLVFGKMGCGKSTFLNYLCRGDINQRNLIKINNSEFVDHLGSECTYIKANASLNANKCLLFDITGKERIADLTEEERARLVSIMGELNIELKNGLDDLVLKRLSEYSTGQKSTLALSRLFYRMEDKTSLIIIDEPADNVQTSLFKTQLEMIKNFAKKNNQILIIVSHRVSEAKGIADKVYHMSDDGVLSQLQPEKIDEFVKEYERDL